MLEGYKLDGLMLPNLVIPEMGLETQQHLEI